MWSHLLSTFCKLPKIAGLFVVPGIHDKHLELRANGIPSSSS